MTALANEIRDALSRASAEKGSDTPDFILATYLIGCLETFNIAVQRRDEWLDRDPFPISRPMTTDRPIDAAAPLKHDPPSADAEIAGFVAGADAMTEMIAEVSITAITEGRQIAPTAGTYATLRPALERYAHEGMALGFPLRAGLVLAEIRRLDALHAESSGG